MSKMFTDEQVKQWETSNASALATVTNAIGEGGLTYHGELKVWGWHYDKIEGQYGERVYYDAESLRRLAMACNSLADALIAALNEGKE